MARSIPSSGFFADGSIVYRLAGQGDFSAAAENAKTLLIEAPDLPMALWVSALHDLQARRGREVVARYEAAFPTLRAGATAIDNLNYFVAVDLAYVLKELGEDERADRLLPDILQQLTGLPRLGFTGYWISDARIYALQSDSTRALKALRQAVDEGWRHSWRAYLLHNPVFDELRKAPEFEAIVDNLYHWNRSKLPCKTRGRPLR